MVENGFQTNFSAQISNELYSLKHKKLSQDSSIKDLRALLWSSIDNDSSKDLDQIEVAEQLPNGDIRLLIAIADVDEYVRKGSTIDAIAKKQTVSVYTETKILPMLPHENSEDLTSLLPNVDR
jgi:exoribonuclease-2